MTPDDREPIRNTSYEERLRRLEFERVKDISRMETLQITLDRLGPLVDRLVQQDQIAEKVAEALDKHDVGGWTRRERRFALVLVCTSVVGACGTLVTIIVLLGGGN